MNRNIMIERWQYNPMEKVSVVYYYASYSEMYPTTVPPSSKKVQGSPTSDRIGLRLLKVLL